MEENNLQPYGVKLEISTNAKGKAQFSVKTFYAKLEDSTVALRAGVGAVRDIIKEQGLKEAE